MKFPSQLWVFDSRLLIDPAHAEARLEQAFLSAVAVTFRYVGSVPEPAADTIAWLRKLQQDTGKQCPYAAEIVARAVAAPPLPNRLPLHGYRQEKLADSVGAVFAKALSRAASRSVRRFTSLITHYQGVHRRRGTQQNWFALVAPNDASYQSIIASAGQIGLVYLIAPDCRIPDGKPFAFPLGDELNLVSRRTDFLRGSVDEAVTARFIIGRQTQLKLPANAISVPSLRILTHVIGLKEAAPANAAVSTLSRPAPQPVARLPKLSAGD